jgi:hypothetical protein
MEMHQIRYILAVAQTLALDDGNRLSTAARRRARDGPACLVPMMIASNSGKAALFGFSLGSAGPW